MKRLFFVALSLLTSQLLFSQQVTLYFESGKYALTARHKQQLDSLIATFGEKLNRYKVELEGHTDVRGNEMANLKLSEQRLASVLSHLSGKGFFFKNEEQSYHGEHKLADQTEDWLNRRVVVRFVKIHIPEPIEELEAVVEEKPKIVNYKEVFPEIGLEKFVFKAEADTQFVYRRSGTSIQIPPNAFVDKNGEPLTGNLTLEYKEIRGLAEIIASGIPMEFKEKGQKREYIFQSSGMFEVRVKSEKGEEAFLKKGKELEMDFVKTDSVRNPDFFVVDEETKTWVRDSSQSPRILNQNYNRRVRAIPKIRTSLATEFGDTLGCFIRSMEEALAIANGPDTIMSYDANVNPDHFVKEFENSYNQRGKIIQPKKQDKKEEAADHIYFERIKEKSTKIWLKLRYDPTLAPELKAFDNCVWTVYLPRETWHYKGRVLKGDDKEKELETVSFFSEKDFNKKFSKKWSEVLISPKNVGNKFLLELKSSKKKGTQNITLRLFLGDSLILPTEALEHKNYAYQLENRSIIMSSTNKWEDIQKVRQNIRIVEFGKLLRDGRDSSLLDENQWLQYFNQNKQEMSVRYAEALYRYKGLSADSLSKIIEIYSRKANRNSYQPIDEKALKASNSIIAKTNLKNLGIGNWDILYNRCPEYLPVMFVDGSGREIVPASVKTIDLGRSSVIENRELEMVCYMPGAKMGVMVISDNKVYYIKSKDFSTAKKSMSRVATLEMEDITEVAKTAEGLNGALR